MATLSDFEEVQIKDHLIAGGFLSSFTDVDGNTQPAPTTQLLEIDMTQILDSGRVVLIRDIGGNTNPSTRIHYKQRNMIIVVVGQNNASDSVICKGLANDINEYLINNPNNGACLMNIQSSGVNGPFTFADSRRAYQINIRVDFNIEKRVWG